MEATSPANYADVNVEPISGNFYRYRRFDDPANTSENRKVERERIERMLAERMVWFAKPFTLNDPFDCRPLMVWSNDMGKNREHIEAVWKEVYERRHGHKPKDRRKIFRHVSKVMAHLKSQRRRNELYVDALDKGTGVLCLSEGWNITQQWTYYAREHTGLCVELNIQKEQLSSYRILYQRERPKIDMIRYLVDEQYQRGLHYESLLVKATDWKHEAEVRILRNGHGNVRLPEGVFRSITFGMAASDEDIYWMRGICKAAGLDISFHRCALDERTFAITREKLADP